MGISTYFVVLVRNVSPKFSEYCFTTSITTYIQKILIDIFKKQLFSDDFEKFDFGLFFGGLQSTGKISFCGNLDLSADIFQGLVSLVRNPLIYFKNSSFTITVRSPELGSQTDIMIRTFGGSKMISFKYFSLSYDQYRSVSNQFCMTTTLISHRSFKY